MAKDRFGGSRSDDGTTEARFDIVYNNRNDATEFRRYSDVTATTLVGKTLLTIDDARRLTAITHKDGSNVTIDSFAYTLDSAGRVTGEVSLLGPDPDYTYDDDDQLTGDGTSTWTFDAAGNRTNAGYEMDTGNRLTTDGAWDYEYDDEGNVVSRIDPGTTETWLYSWNHLNQLVEAEHKDTSAGSVDLRVVYKYDVFGGRIERSVDADGDGSGTAVVERFAFDHNGNIFADLDGSSALTTRRLFLDAVDAVFARIDGEDNLDWYLTDRLGSVRDVMDSAGVIQDHIDYDGFGNVTSESDPGYGDRYKFTGREWDADIEMQLHGRRIYNPQTGAWLSEDPIGFAAGDANLYRYVGNNAANSVDPSGLTEEEANSYRQSVSFRAWTDGDQMLYDTWRDSGSEIPLPAPPFGLGLLTPTMQFMIGLEFGAGHAIVEAIFGLHNLLSNPGAVFNQAVAFVNQLLTLFANGDDREIARMLFPEIYMLVTRWNSLSLFHKGYLLGRVVGQNLAGMAGGAIFATLINRVIAAVNTARRVAGRTLGRLQNGRPPASGGHANPVQGHAPAGGNAAARPHGNGPGATCPNSFAAGTLVLMADGTTKPIEQVKVGDWVWAEDPETGAEGAHQVQATIVGRGEKHLVDIEIDGHTITATDNHPIWVECCKAWFDAAALEPGFEVLTAAGYTLDVDAVQSYTVPYTNVYNLTVAGLHTYFVVAGDVSVLVHNCGPETPAAPNTPELPRGPGTASNPPGSLADPPTPAGPNTPGLPRGPGEGTSPPASMPPARPVSGAPFGQDLWPSWDTPFGHWPHEVPEIRPPGAPFTTPWPTRPWTPPIDHPQGPLGPN